MSDDIFEADGVIVSSYCGSIGPVDRRRFQIAVLDDEQWCVGSLSAEEARDLAEAIMAKLGHVEVQSEPEAAPPAEHTEGEDR